MRLGTPPRRRTRPSLIPLIDVMLVLLFFFMLASTTIATSRTRLELAERGVNGAKSEADVVRAVLLDDGRIAIGEALLALPLAIEQLKPAKDVRLSPAPGVALQTLLDSWQKLAAAGVKVQLAEGAR